VLNNHPVPYLFYAAAVMDYVGGQFWYLGFCLCKKLVKPPTETDSR